MILNHLAIVVAAVSAFAIGGLWYSPLLFQNAWQRVNALSKANLAKGNPALIFGISFLLTLLMAYNLAFFLGNEETDIVWGATAGLLTGLGWITPSIAILALFERRPTRYTLINGGYFIVMFVVMGAIIGAWR